MTQAIQIQQFGGPEVMQLVDLPVGEPAKGQVRIRHHAIGLNFIDVYQRTGLYANPLPLTLGMEGAGIVEAVGEGVAHLKPGDRAAYASLPPGSYSQQRVIDARCVCRLPDDIAFDTGAAMMLKGLTAHYLLKKTLPVAGLAAGDFIVWHAAAGGVGLIACQWARALGLKLIATAGSQDKCRLALENGATHAINYRSEDWVARVKEITGGSGVKVVYDSVGKDTFEGSLNVLQPFGLLASFGNASGPVPPFAPAVLGAKGSLYLTRATLFTHIASRESTQAMADDLFAVVQSGAVKIHIDQRWPMAEVSRRTARWSRVRPPGVRSSCREPGQPGPRALTAPNRANPRGQRPGLHRPLPGTAGAAGCGARAAHVWRPRALHRRAVRRHRRRQHAVPEGRRANLRRLRKRRQPPLRVHDGRWPARRDGLLAGARRGGGFTGADAAVGAAGTRRRVAPGGGKGGQAGAAGQRQTPATARQPRRRLTPRRCRCPGQAGRRVVAPGLQHHVGAGSQRQAFAAGQHMVGAAAGKGQPDAAVEHLQVAAAPQPPGGRPGELDRGR